MVAWRKIAVVNIILLGLFSCQSPVEPRPFDGSNVTGRDLLEPLSEVFETQTMAFTESTQGLKTAMRTWANEGPTAKPAAQEAWVAAMAQWQTLSMMQMGSYSPYTFIWSREIHIPTEIYAWIPGGAGPCTVDVATVRLEWMEPDFFDAMPHQYGLGGMERLLFGGDTHVCPESRELDPEWQA